MKALTVRRKEAEKGAPTSVRFVVFECPTDTKFARVNSESTVGYLWLFQVQFEQHCNAQAIVVCRQSRHAMPFR